MRKNILSFTIFYLFLICIPLESQAQASEADRQTIFNYINADRAKVGLQPLQRWIDGESCADANVKLDAEQDKPHANFRKCGERAQNTCGADSLEDVLKYCLPSFFAEGPAPTPCDSECFKQHVHYMNMTNSRYSKVAIGIYHGEGKYWVNMNFK